MLAVCLALCCVLYKAYDLPTFYYSPASQTLKARCWGRAAGKKTETHSASTVPTAHMIPRAKQKQSWDCNPGRWPQDHGLSGSVTLPLWQSGQANSSRGDISPSSENGTDREVSTPTSFNNLGGMSGSTLDPLNALGVPPAVESSQSVDSWVPLVSRSRIVHLRAGPFAPRKPHTGKAHRPQWIQMWQDQRHN